jgi:hypothetical protein
MKKISFQTDVLPHLLAVAAFLIITLMFFSPVFFDNMALSQGDITQFLWSSNELREYRKATGEEGLWAGAMFSGMPAYLINLQWSDGVLITLKRIASFFMPHPVNSIFLAFVSYYIMLLAFRVRPFLAIAGAIAFGLSSYMIIGLSAGHNSRIGAIAFMPLVMAGIHLVFTNKKILGFAVTALGMALHLRENHLQITYYLAIVVGAYGIVQLVEAINEKRVPELAKNVGLLVGAVAIAVGSFFGQLWAVGEISTYSHRGTTELKVTSKDTAGGGLPKSSAFEFSNGILEPMTLLLPNFYGGSSSESVLSDTKSDTYKALMNSGDNESANQLAQFSSAYWGPQRLAAPYYAGAIIVFLFVLGLLMVERKYVWWLASVSVIAIMLSWGDSFQAFNYFIFDYLPGYNKFRSVTFCLVIVFFSMPLLGMLALEKFLTEGPNDINRKKLWLAFGFVGGLCLIFFVIPGVLGFLKSDEAKLPVWFTNALASDRKALLRSDAIRSLGFIFVIFIMLFFNVPKRISSAGFFAVLALLVTIDLAMVDSRYFSKDRNYIPASTAKNFDPSGADTRILQDKSYYRVFNLQNFYEANTSNFHNSLGGYSGVRLKRYQELYDTCISRETQQIYEDAGAGPLNMEKYGVLNMLNAKYFVYGTDANQVLQNTSANGNAWFPRDILLVNSPNEELEKVGDIDTRLVAVVDQSKMKLTNTTAGDSTGKITFIEKKPNYQKYEAETTKGGFGVFSEIFYPKGWTATIDGKEVPILRANYVLRALEIPAGKHTIEFLFQPKPYVIGNKVTMISSILLLIVVIGALYYELREEPKTQS